MEKIQTGQELLLLYNVEDDTELGQIFRRLALQFGARIRELEISDLDSSIRLLFTGSDKAAEKITEERLETLSRLKIQEAKRGFCVFCGFSKAGFESLLKDWHEAKVSRIAQKAVATTHNQDWPLHALFTELEREHAVTTAFVSLRRDVHQLEERLKKEGLDLSMDIETQPQPLRDKLRALHEAKQLLSDIRAIELADEIKSVHQALKHAWERP